MTTSKPLTMLAVLGAAGLLLAGCGGGTQVAGSAPAGTSAAASPTPPTTSADTGSFDQQSVKYENLMADCMKAAGFDYKPHPLEIAPATSAVVGKNAALVPYDQLKTYRTKYGFGAFYAQDVYPNDPNVAPKEAPIRPDPNQQIRDALGSAQKHAYNLAYDGGWLEKITAGAPKTSTPQGGCTAKIAKEVYGEGVQTQEQQGRDQQFKAAEQQFETNSAVLSAAQAYGDCLRGHGYQVTSTKPGVIENTMGQAVQQEHTDHPNPDPRAGLTKEIKTALDDLDCGKAYEAAAKPFVEKLMQLGVG
jgi:hypothetical protein